MDREQLKAWRDTLGELGVMGLVRAEDGLRAPGSGLPASEGQQPSPRPSTPPITPARNPRRDAPSREPGARSLPPEGVRREPKYLPPTDPQGCPPPEAVASAPDLSALAAAIQGCLKCPLGPGRIKFVFGEGNPRAQLMFIGEGPGRDEDLQGRPFVGKTGELLDKMIGAIGYERRQVYIANVVKCLRYNTLVLLENGQWERIGRLVAQKYAGCVMSVDAEGRIVPKRVTGWHRTPLGDRRMYRLTQAHSSVQGGGKAVTWLTHDHEVMTRRGWVQAEDLRTDDEIATGYGLSSKAEEVLQGSLLGDGHLNARSAHLSIIHAAKQKGWLEWKAQALRELPSEPQPGSSNAEGKAHPTVRFRTLASRALRPHRHRWYPAGRKRVPRDLKLTPLMVAVWFLDDGHLRQRPGKAPLAEIACHGFLDEDRLYLIQRLQSDCGIPAYQRPAHPGRLHFDAEATRGLSDLIAPYTPPSMRYKLHPESSRSLPFDPEHYRPEGPPRTSFDKIHLDRNAFKGTDRSVFCLDVEDTHNFVTSGGVVHNCRPPDNRTPVAEEAQACLGYLRRQIELIQPSVIVTLGATPLRELVGVSEGITRVRGQWKQVRVGERTIPVMPTFHPAYVLRQYTQDVRKAVWEDLKAARAWVDKAAGD